MIKNKNLTLAVILLYPFMKLITEKFKSSLNAFYQLYNISILGFLKINTGMTTIVRIFLSCYF